MILKTGKKPRKTSKARREATAPLSPRPCMAQTSQRLVQHGALPNSVWRERLGTIAQRLKLFVDSRLWLGEY
jgi:hypothetical protein